ncbi:GatB/YqeY domain-containing protein [Candidatus Margulisiibacteriota bacterium]
MSEAETKDAVAKIVAAVGASSPKDMGKVMKEIMAKGLNVDGKTASKIVRDLLTPKT